jgi:hypothetical protein
MSTGPQVNSAAGARDTRGGRRSPQEDGRAVTEDIQILVDLTGAAYRLAGRQMSAAGRFEVDPTEAALREAYKRLGEALWAANRALETSRR